jgi:hypothetical protein
VMDDPFFFSFLMTCVVLPSAYLLPSIVARLRHAEDAGSIFVTNLVLGWTGIGWLIALLLAVQNPKRRPPSAHDLLYPVGPWGHFWDGARWWTPDGRAWWDSDIHGWRTEGPRMVPAGSAEHEFAVPAR